jgi:AcrR family transcriptional regulator
MTATDQSLRRKRPGGRRDVILNAALELFARQGYQATGIDEIGAAAGVSGPAIYRHFGSKQDLLTAAFTRTLDAAREQLRESTQSVGSPGEKVELFVRSIVHNALDDRLLLALYTREVEHLPREERKIVHRKHRQLINDWAGVLQEANPELADGDARLAVLAVINMIGILGFTDGGLSRTRLEDLLVNMSLAALAATGDATHNDIDW